MYFSTILIWTALTCHTQLIKADQVLETMASVDQKVDLMPTNEGSAFHLEEKAAEVLHIIEEVAPETLSDQEKIERTELIQQFLDDLDAKDSDQELIVENSDTLSEPHVEINSPQAEDDFDLSTVFVAKLPTEEQINPLELDYYSSSEINKRYQAARQELQVKMTQFNKASKSFVNAISNRSHLKPSKLYLAAQHEKQKVEQLVLKSREAEQISQTPTSIINEFLSSINGEGDRISVPYNRKISFLKSTSRLQLPNTGEKTERLPQLLGMLLVTAGVVGQFLRIKRN